VHSSCSQINKQGLSFHNFNINCQHIIENWFDKFRMNLNKFIKAFQSSNSGLLIKLNELNGLMKKNVEYRRKLHYEFKLCDWWKENSQCFEGRNLHLSILIFKSFLENWFKTTWIFHKKLIIKWVFTNDFNEVHHCQLYI